MRVVWITGDQLHEDHPALLAADRAKDRVLFIESRKRSEQQRYHQIKLVLIFSAMRHRAAALQRAGWKVDYVSLTGSFLDALKDYVARHRPEAILVEDPSQYDHSKGLPALGRELGVKIEIFPTNQFLVSRDDFSRWAGESRHLIMEHHYRRVRKALGILVDPQGRPEGGAWNFDPKNRGTHAALVKSHEKIPAPPRVTPDEVTREVIALVKKEFADHPGDAEEFWLPVTREESVKWLKQFITQRLENFGRWEDVMSEGDEVLFHSVLSPMLNIGLLKPRECVDAAVAAYEAGRAPIESVEGFVRQIIGWREFVNGVYWHAMPGYVKHNALDAKRSLPGWLYTGETEMNCLRQTIRQVLHSAYNHHIQRLMVLGNFFLLGGFDPRAVLRWYTEMYADAHDWVMAANVIGMILHADGGYMATKPYAAGAAYIHRMSNYCEGCRFKPTARTGPEACPYNYLYWNFFAQHAERFAHNPRVAMAIRTWKRKPREEQETILRQAKEFLAAL
jgi:deoxyribodipyrimidine photolyase-related protein